MDNDDQNPLFQNLQPKKRVIQPLPGQTGRGESAPNPAADVIRQKIDSLFTDEPNSKEEIQEVHATPKPQRSKHQQFMYELSESGKSLAEIQTAWHQYYQNLPDAEKHAVWQEFYSEHSKVDHAIRQAKEEPKPPKSHSHKLPETQKPIASTFEEPRPTDQRTAFDIKKQLTNRIQTRAQINKKGHLQSLLFGLGMGAIVMVVLLFGFFNERIIAPFVTPSRSVSSTPIITNPNSTTIGPESKIIIPKINVEIPVVYDEPSIQEEAVQKALERGVLHYATTPNPGEVGNGVIFGHSSNNILNKGKYKFAFVLLSRLESGDTFMLDKGGKRYVYKVFSKKVVKPTDLSVLSKTSKTSTFSLITCDPPGTSINRLVVVGEQVSPDPNANIASTVPPAQTTQEPTELPSNSPSLWSRLTSWL